MVKLQLASPWVNYYNKLNASVYDEQETEDYCDQCSTFYQNIAADIFKPIDGVHYCTDKPYYRNEE